MNLTNLFVGQAVRRLEAGDPQGAIELFKKVLGHDPNDASVHALLALTLLSTKRLHAAELEAGLALQLEPMSGLALTAAARVAIARNQLSRAGELAARAVAADPEDAAPLRIQATLSTMRGQPDVAVKLLRRARGIEPENTHVLGDLAELLLGMGKVEEAEEVARDALSIEAAHADSLVVMGHVFLKRGDLDAAHDQAVWVLSHNPDHEGALHLIAAIKARRNPVLGLWWRYHTWMSELGQTGVVVVLLGAYFVYRVVALATEDLGYEQLSNGVEVAWLGICAFTWFGPAIFRRMVNREVGRVELDPEF